MSDSSAALPYKQWQAPPSATPEDTRLGWLSEATEEGIAWLKSQRGYYDHRKSLDILSGIDTAPPVADYRSRVATNRLKRNFREVTGALAKLRPMWGYHSDNKSYADKAAMMNRVTRAWYLEQFADRSVKEALQYAGATGRGWARPVYRRDLFGTGRGDIKIFTYGAPCILPNQLPASGDWQSAYTVHILDEMPVAMAHGMFPSFQHRLNPSSSRYWYMNDGVRRAAQGNWLSRAFSRVGKVVGGGTGEGLTDLLVPIRYSYIIDLSINKTDKQIPMGEPGASWAYTVPFIGQQIPAGTDLATGSPTFRIANENDARLYPYRRLIISSDSCITYDGPSFDWHGMFPAISFCLDDFPWEPLGFSLIRDGYEIQHAINKILRGNMDKIDQQLDPSLTFDTNATSMSEARRFDPYKPRDRIGYDGSAIEGQPFSPAVDPETLKVSPESMAMVEKLEQTLDAQMAIADVFALAKMRAVGSMDELEKIMEANGPIIEDMSRSMEPPMRDLGNMVKFLICQYYTTSRVMQWVGVDGVSREVFDYDPASLIPSHAPGENPDRDSSMDKIRRARLFADNLRFFIMPGSMHELTQMVMKLGLIQLKKEGIKISSQTIAEAWNVPNYGSFDGSTEIEKWRSEQETDLEFAARLAAIQAGIQAAASIATDTGGAGPSPALAPGAPPPPVPAGGGIPPPGAPTNNEGRPNSYTAPPQLQTKDGGTRTTITTSK